MNETLRIIVLIGLSFPLIVGVALVSSRLLGVRRSWVAILMSSLIGWTAGLLVSLGIAGGLHDARLLRTTVVLSFVFTMAAAVGLDLLRGRARWPKATLRVDSWSRDRSAT